MTEKKDPTEYKLENLLQVQDYSIGQIIQAHKSDAKCLAITEGQALITGGRDNRVAWWGRRQGKFHETMAYTQPNNLSVNSIAYAELEDGWRLFVGRKDGSIAVYASGNPEPVQVFHEHNQNVCCLHINKQQTHMLSGSWDNNVVIWPIADLQKDSFVALKAVGHSMSIWALTSFPEIPDRYLTASADQTIKMWNRDEEMATFTGHTDVVRALHVLSNDDFISAGNDGLIIHWNVQARAAIGKFSSQCHPYIYNMTVLGSHVLTTGEDGAVEFWKMENKGMAGLTVTSELVVHLPSSNTWDVKVFYNKDIAVAGSDGRVFILTTDPAKKASQDIQEALEAEIVVKVTAKDANRKADNAETVIIKVDVDDRPTQLELKYKKGTDPELAAQEFIRENALPHHHLTEITNYIKERIPEARAFSWKPGQKVTVDGEQYDYALSVSLENGIEMKMPFNVTESPQFAAQRFIEKKGLPISALPALAGMISSEMDKVSTGRRSNNFDDPLTGSGRYVPGGGSSDFGSGGADPFTGSGRYVPGGTSGGLGGFSGDPLTGDGGYRTSENTGQHAVPLSSMPIDKRRPRGPLVPVPDYYIIGLSGKGEKAVARLREFNEKQDAFQLNADQMNSLEELFLVPPTSNYSSEVTQSAFEVALQWSEEYITPVLDFFRVALMHESLNTYFCSGARGRELIERFIAILVSEPEMAVKVLVSRAIGNAFAHPTGRNLFASTELSILAPLIVRLLSSDKAVLQISAATTLANWSLCLLKQSEKVEQMGPKEDLLRAIVDGVEHVTSFGCISEEALIKLLQAIVTVMWGDLSVCKIAKNRGMVSLAARMKDACAGESGKNIARDIVEMVYSIPG